jgi:hypothetical protein
MRFVWLLMIGAAVAVLAPGAGAAANDDELLRKALTTFFREPEILRVDAVPDLYEGGYARISVYARRVVVGEWTSLRVDEGWVRLVGVSLSPEALRKGMLKVESVRDSAIHMRISLRNLERYFTGGDLRDVQFWAEEGFLYGSGTVPLKGIPTRVRMKGFFALGGTAEVYFYVENLRMNGLPLPHPLIRHMEKQYNPIVTQRDWPVRFKLRSLRLTKDDLVLSSATDPTTCSACLGTDAPALLP